MSVQEIAVQFIEAINRQDVATICELMTEDHRFIDSEDQIFDGRERMKTGWADYFKIVPDYRIEVSETFVSGNTVVFLGHGFGTYTSDGNLKPENYWQTPAAWKAVIASEKVRLWQVFADNEPIRKLIRAEKNL